MPAAPRSRSLAPRNSSMRAAARSRRQAVPRPTSERAHRRPPRAAKVSQEAQPPRHRQSGPHRRHRTPGTDRLRAHRHCDRSRACVCSPLRQAVATRVPAESPPASSPRSQAEQAFVARRRPRVPALPTTRPARSRLREEAPACWHECGNDRALRRLDGLPWPQFQAPLLRGRGRTSAIPVPSPARRRWRRRTTHKRYDRSRLLAQHRRPVQPRRSPRRALRWRGLVRSRTAR